MGIFNMEYSVLLHNKSTKNEVYRKTKIMVADG